MSNDSRSLTLHGFTGSLSLFILFALGIVATCLYLTSHYFDAHYPSSLGGAASFCDMGQFFNCDGATFSPLAQIALVPTSFLGLLVGITFLLGTLFPSEGVEKTLKFISLINLIGCVFLLFYSLFIIKGLCPMCSLYYLLSLGCFLLFFFQSDFPFIPEVKPLAVISVLFIIAPAIMHYNVSDQSAKQQKINQALVKDFFAKEKIATPPVSDYIIHQGSDNFDEGIIRISVFSDFQCPFCQKVAEQMETLIRLYANELNIQYFFFPLDSQCNDKVSRAIHPQACSAAYLAGCERENFRYFHDEIFAHQGTITKDFLQKLAGKKNAEGCFDDKEVQQKIKDSIQVGHDYNINSTPTLIINDVKISGTLQNNQFRAIFDAIIKRNR